MATSLYLRPITPCLIKTVSHHLSPSLHTYTLLQSPTPSSLRILPHNNSCFSMSSALYSTRANPNPKTAPPLPSPRPPPFSSLNYATPKPGKPGKVEDEEGPPANPKVVILGVALIVGLALVLTPILEKRKADSKAKREARHQELESRVAAIRAHEASQQPSPSQSADQLSMSQTQQKS